MRDQKRTLLMTIQSSSFRSLETPFLAWGGALTFPLLKPIILGGDCFPKWQIRGRSAQQSISGCQTC